MWDWWLPDALTDNHVAVGLLQLLLTGIIMVINQRFFISGCKSLLHGAPNMDTLVALGAGTSFVYSTYALFAMTDAQAKGNIEAVMAYMHEFYFESAAMILTLITVGKMLEARSKGRTTDALKGLMKLAPKTAVVIRENVETEIPVEQVKKGDVFVVRPGENIPVDGVVLEGSSAVNEAALTGESIPVDKEKGDSVSAATLNQSGFIKCRSNGGGGRHHPVKNHTDGQRCGGDKSADCESGRQGIRRLCAGGDCGCGGYDSGMAACGKGYWLCAGAGISVLVISCPCALGAGKRPLPLWSAMAAVQKTVSCLKQQFLWKKPVRCGLWCWIKQEPLPQGSFTLLKSKVYRQPIQMSRFSIYDKRRKFFEPSNRSFNLERSKP